jgi:hypothetical protein
VNSVNPVKKSSRIGVIKIFGEPFFPMLGKSQPVAARDFQSLENPPFPFFTGRPAPSSLCLFALKRTRIYEGNNIMQQTPSDPQSSGKELSPEVRTLLMAIGRGLGTVSVYGTEHPSVKMSVTQTHQALQGALTSGSIAIGTFNGTLTVNGEPVLVTDIPIKMLEKRLVSMKVSHLALHAGLTEEELQHLLTALCAPTGEAMKETLAKSGTRNIQMEDVKYVTLRNGEQKTGQGGGGSGSGEGDSGSGSGERAAAQAQLKQIIAFLKGDPGTSANLAQLKKALSDPQKLGQMILAAATVQQKETKEDLGDLIISSLKRAYDGLSKESVFESAQGKATLAKTMLRVEQTILRKIQGPGSAASPGLDRRIQAEFRGMEKERQLDMLSTHYAEQCAKRDKTEQTMIQLIRPLGAEKAREHLMSAGIPPRDWKRLLRECRGQSQPTPGNGPGHGGHTTELTDILEKLGGLLQLAQSNPAGAKTAIMDARQGINSYTSLANAQIYDIETRIQESDGKDRDKLILEISKLTLSLMQPLTVINGSIEAALITPDPDLHRELLELAHESGQSLDTMTKRMMELTDYPELNEADDHLKDWIKT